MKNVFTTIALLAITSLFSSCSNEADYVMPERSPSELSKEVVDAPSTGRNDLSLETQVFSISEDYVYNDNTRPENREYRLEVNPGNSPDELILTGLAENMELKVTAHKQDNSSFTFAQAIDNVPGFEGQVQISGAGEFTNKWVRIYYSLQSAEGVIQAEALGSQQ